MEATFNNISVISWRSILLVDETGVPGENHRPVASHWQTLSHNILTSTPRNHQVWLKKICISICAYLFSWKHACQEICEHIKYPAKKSTNTVNEPQTIIFINFVCAQEIYICYPKQHCQGPGTSFKHTKW
jgi:hypothetical protein